jgi:TonB-dependent SusC/RagA subfamily outer membrane receptor
MRERLIVVAVLIISTTMSAQYAQDSLVLTEEENENWILNLEKETKIKQLDLIRKRILLDTIIYLRQGLPDRIKINYEKGKGVRTEGQGRVLLVFNRQYLAYINNKTRGQSVAKLTSYLTDNKIEGISIIRNPQASAIYGSRAAYGVIILTTKNEKILRQIKELDLSVD